jgi:hypothetical protein
MRGFPWKVKKAVCRVEGPNGDRAGDAPRREIGTGAR